MAGRNVTETEFVDAARGALVDRLETAYADVRDRRTPRWISIEAPSGWGKSRLVQELYRRLAERHQDDGRYWPPSISDSLSPQAAGSLESLRKRTHPERLDPERGSTPAWFWWGIGCDQRHGTPMAALAHDIGQFHRAAPGFEARWAKEASGWDKVRRAATGEGARELAAVGAEEAVAAGLGALNIVVPGFGFVALGVQRLYRAVRDGRAEEGSPSESSTVDLVDDVAPGVTRVAREVIPVVIFVEDLHLADATLIDLLARMLNVDDTRVLVVTTSWPGEIEEPGAEAAMLLARVPVDRRSRWSTAAGGDVRLTDFSPGALRALATSLVPDASPSFVDELVESYQNPLALQLVCSSQRVQRALADGHDAATVLASMPREVRQLYESLWEELPVAIQRICMLAALSTSNAISQAWGGGDNDWDHEAVVAAATTVPWLRAELGDLEDQLLREQVDAYGWVREVSTWLRRFHEPSQQEVATQAARDLFDDPFADLGEYFQALAARLDPTDGDEGRALHHARLLVALEAEGFIERGPSWLSAARAMVGHLAVQPDVHSARQLSTLAGAFLERTPSDAPDGLAVRAHLADAVGRAWGAAAGVDRMQAVVRDQRRLLGPDHPETLDSRRRLVRLLRDADRRYDAGREGEQLLEELRRSHGPEHPETLAVAALVLTSRSASAELEPEYRQLLALHEQVFGPDDERSLFLRGELALLLRAIDRVEDASSELERLLTVQRRIGGDDHPRTLWVRSQLAANLRSEHRYEDAVDSLRAVLDDHVRVLGVDHPDTLRTLDELVTALRVCGRFDQALEASTELAEHHERILGAEHDKTLRARLEVLRLFT